MNIIYNHKYVKNIQAIKITRGDNGYLIKLDNHLILTKVGEECIENNKSWELQK